MALGLLFQAVGVTGLAFSQQWWATLPMIIFGLSLAAFIPAQQSYISDRVAYEKRGRTLAAVEFAWAMAGIVSLPLIGLMIDRFGWRTPFFLLALFSLISAIMIWLQLPSVEQRSHTGLNPGMILILARRSNILASVGISILLFIGVNNFITIWGIWLSADFGLAATALGLVATAVGLAELGGSGLSSLFIDRVGKRRGSLIGLLLTATAFLIMPLTQFSLWVAVLGLVLLGVLLEFSVVSLIPLYSEQAPEARATTFSMTALGASIGSAVGSPLTAILWEQSGLWAVSLVSTFCLIVAAILLFSFLKEH
jgi:predicted MFS family arabinose efflux permease